jgi:hypothetical protein
MFMPAGPATLYLCRCLDRADVHACPAFQAELHVHKRTVLNKTDGRPGAEINTPAAPNTFFPVNSNHPASPLDVPPPAFFRVRHSITVMHPFPGIEKN